MLCNHRTKQLSLLELATVTYMLNLKDSSSLLDVHAKDMIQDEIPKYLQVQGLKISMGFAVAFSGAGVSAMVWPSK